MNTTNNLQRSLFYLGFFLASAESLLFFSALLFGLNGLYAASTLFRVAMCISYFIALIGLSQIYLSKDMGRFLYLLGIFSTILIPLMISIEHLPSMLSYYVFIMLIIKGVINIFSIIVFFSLGSLIHEQTE